MSILSKLFGKDTSRKHSKAASALGGQVIPRSKHNISRRRINTNALKVLNRLNKGNYQAYLVGGSVRDLLLDETPKDFDVATDALPEDVNKLFRNCRLIGRRFRLAHIHFGREIIEVATFRAHHALGSDTEGQTRDGMIVRDNVYGNLEQDAERRDFTINALYYNIADFSVIDFSTGVADLNSRIIRLIGDPQTRYREDPVRILRAVRFAGKLGFTIEAATEAPILSMGALLSEVPPARLFEEIRKLFHGGHAEDTYHLLRHYKLFHLLFPQAAVIFDEAASPMPEKFLLSALRSTDKRIAEGKPINPAFILAVALWPSVVELASALEKEDGLAQYPALEEAMEEVLHHQLQLISVPRRFTQTMRDIWRLQYRLPQRRGKRAFRLMTHPRFRAAYDFMLLRIESGETKFTELGDWWTKFQECETPEKKQLIASLSKKH